MQTGTAMKMASRSIDLISRKTNCTCRTLFFSNQQKNKFARAACFLSFFAVVFAQLQGCFVGLNRQTSQLHVFLMEELSYVLTQYFVSCVHVRFYFSLPLHFHLAGHQHFSIGPFIRGKIRRVLHRTRLNFRINGTFRLK